MFKLQYIDKAKYFGKKNGSHIPLEVAPKTTGSTKGYWVWHRERNEQELSARKLIKERKKDKKAYKKSKEPQRKQQLFLLKTGKFRLDNKSYNATWNICNRLEVTNSLLLKFFIASAAVVTNTITYSTYHREKNDVSDKLYLEEYRYGIDSNGCIKEEVASLYAGKFDGKKGYSKEKYNMAVLQKYEFKPLRENFVIFGLMNFSDVVGHYDNFAFIDGKFIITDTGVGSGNIGDFERPVVAKSNFHVEVLRDFDTMFDKNGITEEVRLFQSSLKISDILAAIDKLKYVDLLSALDEAFKPVPNPFKQNEPRYNSFVNYNNALQQHKQELFNIYKERINRLLLFGNTLRHFYDNTMQSNFSLPKCEKLLV